MRMWRIAVATPAVAALATFGAIGVAGAALEIAECGAVVPAGETAYLIADLDCDASSSEGIVLSDRARLVLGGYGIFAKRAQEERQEERTQEREDAERDLPSQGVRCRTGSVCTIIGPGEISGFAAAGIAGTRVRARQVVVSGNGRAGIVAYENIVLRDSLIIGNGSLGVHAGGRLRIRGSEVLSHPNATTLQWRNPRFRPGDETHAGD